MMDAIQRAYWKVYLTFLGAKHGLAAEAVSFLVHWYLD